ncbi:MAG: cysteine protease ATG4 [archaeon]|nr:cysteine protease ATG4 [archaeon]
MIKDNPQDKNDFKSVNQKKNLEGISGFEVFDFCDEAEIIEPEENKLKESKSGIQNDIVLHSLVIRKNKTTSGLFSTIKELTTTLYYSYTNNSKFDPLKQKTFTIYNTEVEFQRHKTITGLSDHYLSIIYFTYRNNFEAIKGEKGESFTNDNTWGCMLRSCQMLLAKGIFERKKYIFFQNKEKNNPPIKNRSSLDNQFAMYLKKNNDPYVDLLKIRCKVISYFYDNSINIETIYEDHNFDFFRKQIEEISKLSPNILYAQKFKPPFSIDNICYVTGKAGKHNSDLIVINAFIQINKQFFGEEDSFLYFNNEKIKRQKVLDSFCQEVDKEYFEKNCNDKTKTNFILFNQKYHCFKRGGLIFVSLRLGLSKIDDIYIHSMYNFFKSVRNNIGFVSGTNNKGYYFIGVAEGKLLFLDPHFSQKAINPEIDDIQSYFHKDIFLLKPEDLSSALTFGVVINSAEDIIKFFVDIQKLSTENPYFISFE